MIRSTWATVVPSSTACTRSPEQPRRGERGQRGEHVQRERAPEHPRVPARDVAGVAAYRAGVGDGKHRVHRRPPSPARLRVGLGLAGDDHAVVAVVVSRSACVPVATIRPPRRNATSSTASSTSGLLDVTTVVRPRTVGAQARGDPCLGVGVDRRRRLDEHQDLGVDASAPGPAPAAAAGHRRSSGRVSLDLGVEARRGAPRGCRRPTRWPIARVDVAAPLTSSRSTSRPENSVAPVSETTIRRRTSDRASRLRGTPPRGHVVVDHGAHMPSRSASAADSSGCSDTTAVTDPVPDPQAGPQRRTARSPRPGTSAGSLGVGVVGVEREHRADARGGDPAPDQLVGVLGGGAQRDHQERGVAVERDQLAGRDRAPDGVPRTEPDHEHHEDAGQEHLRARRAPTGASRPRRPARRVCLRLATVAVEEDLLAADPAQHAQAAHDVAGGVAESAPIRCAGARCASGAGLSSGPMSSIRSGTPISTSRPSVTEVVQQDHRRPAGRRRPRRRTGRSRPSPARCGTRSLVPIATTSPVDTLRGRVPPRWTVCRPTSWTMRYAAVSQFVTAKRCRMIPLAAWTRPIEQHHQGVLHELAGVLGGHAAVDRAADHGRHHRLRAHPDDAEEHPQEKGVPLAPRDPPQELPGRPVIRRTGMVEGELAHYPTLSSAP